MKQREQALLLLKKAAQDEALLDEVLASARVSDEVIGFHYGDYDSEPPLDRGRARALLASLRRWVESQLRERYEEATGK